jgi:hypothetical protein
MGTARADTAERRLGLYRGLMRRNRAVAVLRLAVPVLGAALLAAFLVQLYLAGLARDFSIAGIGIDRDNLVVEGPAFEGRTAEGTAYRITADSARLALGDPDRIAFAGPRLVFERAGASTVTATAAAAEFVTSGQRLEIAGETRLGDGAGLDGTLRAVSVDFRTEVLRAAGPVELRLPGGLTILAESLDHDSRAGRWEFSRASVTLAATPGEGAP